VQQQNTQHKSQYTYVPKSLVTRRLPKIIVNIKLIQNFTNNLHGQKQNNFDNKY